MNNTKNKRALTIDEEITLAWPILKADFMKAVPKYYSFDERSNLVPVGEANC